MSFSAGATDKVERGRKGGRGRSAELHSAVPRIFNPLTPPVSGHLCFVARLAECNSATQRIENLRYEPRRACLAVAKSAQSREGRPGIAHRLIGGNRRVNREKSPVRDERNHCGVKFYSAVPDGTRFHFASIPALKRWAMVGRPSGLKG